MALPALALAHCVYNVAGLLIHCAWDGNDINLPIRQCLTWWEENLQFTFQCLTTPNHTCAAASPTSTPDCFRCSEVRGSRVALTMEMS